MAKLDFAIRRNQISCNFSIEDLGTIYSAITFLESCRKVVGEIWFEKSGSIKVVDQKKRWFYTINPHFFRLEKSG